MYTAMALPIFGQDFEKKKLFKADNRVVKTNCQKVKQATTYAPIVSAERGVNHYFQRQLIIYSTV